MNIDDMFGDGNSEGINEENVRAMMRFKAGTDRFVETMRLAGFSEADMALVRETALVKMTHSMLGDWNER
jgi:hypothetical protein